MSRRKKKDNNLIIILIAIVLLIILVALLVTIIKKITTNKNEVYTNDIITNVAPDIEYEETMNIVREEFEEIGQIVPENYNFLTRMYEGNIEDTVLYSKIYDFIRKTVPETYKLLKDYDDTQITNYFNENRQTIINNLGIENADDYVKMVNQIKNIGDKNYISSSFDVSKYEAGEKYSTVPLIIQYKGVVISIDVSIINNEDDNLPSVCLGASQAE